MSVEETVQLEKKTCVLNCRFTHCIIRKKEIMFIVAVEEIPFAYVTYVIISFRKFKGCTNRGI